MKELKKAFESAEKHWVRHFVPKVIVWIENKTKASKKVMGLGILLSQASV